MSTHSPETKTAEIVVDTGTEANSNVTDHPENPATNGGDEEADIVLRNPMERPVFKLSVNLIDTYKYINKVSKKLYKTFI